MPESSGAFEHILAAYEPATRGLPYLTCNRSAR